MQDALAWIVTDDDRLAVELSSLLARHAGCEGLCLPSSAVLDDDHQPAGTPAHIFIDLRASGPVKETLLAWHRWNRWREDRVPLIGIVDRGFAPALAIEAPHLLAETLRWPAEEREIRKLVAAMATREPADTSDELQFRALRGSGVEFTTYQPELFPVVEELAVAAQQDFTVLLVGETGTGKTTLARLIHELSARRASRFLTVACGALPNDLIDSELFGHVKGSFTGADANKIGKFDAAQDGSILLDEIDVLGFHQQAKLLRILETGEFEAVGSNETRACRARAIVASNLCLETLISRGHFRADLYYRLSQMKIEIPPLRKRRRDIVPLAMQFIHEFCEKRGLVVDQIDVDVLELLRNYPWPGNLRELRNEVHRMLLVSRGGVLTPDHLSPTIVQESNRARVRTSPLPVAGLADEVAVAEQEAIEQMLAMQNFNRTATARALGISRVTLYNKIRKYGIRLAEGEIEAAGDDDQ